MRLRSLSLVATVAATLLATHPATAQTRSEVKEVFSPDGSISRQRVEVPVGGAASALAVAAVTPVQETGPTASKFDLVFVGDGYTAADMPLYRQHVLNRWNELVQVEPFKSMKNSFNVWQVEVVSAQSGVDNDPTRGVLKNTAMDSNFWCGGTERLLCVNETKARQYAAQAPAADQILVLANSTKYGGAGGSVATSSGGNALSGQIVVHELGHSVGGLADEYDYPDDLYTGPEPREKNVSTLNADTMRSRQTKWYAYLGRTSPDGGVVGTYEGAHYHKRGVYRPTQDSLMRSLGKPFNLIGLDVMTAAIRAKAPNG